MGKRKHKRKRILVEVSDAPRPPQLRPSPAAAASVFLHELSPLLREQWLEASLGSSSRRSQTCGAPCPGFDGLTSGVCCHCAGAAVQHELLLSPYEGGERHAAGGSACCLGHTATFLQLARTAATQFHSLSWAESLLGVAAATWADAADALDALGSAAADDHHHHCGPPSGRCSQARSVVDELLEHGEEGAPPEISYWRARVVAAGAVAAAEPRQLGGPGGPDQRGVEQLPLSVADVEEMRVRLLCHIDETYFRLFYYTLTEVPSMLARNVAGGVPDFVDYLTRAVRGSWEGSVWADRGCEQFCAWLEREYCAGDRVGCAGGGPAELSPADAVDLLQHAARTVDRRGGGLTGVSGAPAAAAADTNDLLAVYGLIQLETHLLFHSAPALADRARHRWATLLHPGPTGPHRHEEQPLQASPMPSVCGACCGPLRSGDGSRSGTHRKKKSKGKAPPHCVYCTHPMCPKCRRRCVGCGGSVCQRCCHENFDLDTPRDFCPRCDTPLCWPTLARWRDAVRCCCPPTPFCTLSTVVSQGLSANPDPCAP